MKLFTTLSLTFLIASSAMATVFPINSTDKMIGHIQFSKVQKGDTFASIARQFDIGYYELLEANPNVDPDHPAVDSMLIVPTQYLLPDTERKGIVINLAAMRLYYFPPNENKVYTYPVGIGKYNWGTPLGKLHILEKITNPTWHVPQSIQEHLKSKNLPAPSIVPPGPDNPLGKYALRLSKPTYLIHDTNNPASVGRRSSAGCVHLYPEDIKLLFNQVSINTPVLIINEPYKTAMIDDTLYLEAHLPLQEDQNRLANKTAVAKSLLDGYTEEPIEKTKTILEEHLGIPIALER